MTDHFGPLPEYRVNDGFRSGKFLDVEIIGTIWIGGDATFQGDITATGGSITGDLTITGTLTGGDILSGNWDGASPANLATKDLTATTGYYLDGSAGGAQFQNIYAEGGSLGLLTVDNTITLGTGGKLLTAAVSGPTQRIEMLASSANTITFYSGDADEEAPGFMTEQTSGAGVTRTLQFGTFAPYINVNDQGVAMVVRSASADASTFAPAVVIAATPGGNPGNGSGLDPEFRIQSGIPLISDGRIYSTNLGTAAAPTFGIGTSGDDGFFSSTDGTLNVVTSGVQRAWVSGEQSNQAVGTRNVGAFGVYLYNTNLGGTAGNRIGGQSWGFDAGDNLVNLELEIIRDSTGTDYTTAAVGFRRVTDTTGQQSLWFPGNGGVAVNASASATGMEFTVNGQIACVPNTVGAANTGQWTNISGSYYEWQRYTSSLRYKTDVSLTGEYVDGLADIELTPYQFYRKDDKAMRYGLIAEYLAEQNPQLVTYDIEGRPDSPDPMALLTVLAAKVNRLEKEIL